MQFTNSTDKTDDMKEVPSFDDDEFDELLLNATKSNKGTESNNTACDIRNMFSNQNMACKHTCKDKTK